MMRILALALLAFVIMPPASSSAQSPAGAPLRQRSALPADPWPREVKVSNAALLVYQPQVESWTGNMLSFRSAVAVRPTSAKDEVFRVIWATARTQVARSTRIDVLAGFKVTKSNSPTLPDQGPSYVAALQAKMPPPQRTIALDRLEASLAALGAVKPVTFLVNNDPPRIIVS